MEDLVILVDKYNKQVGAAEKLRAHKEGLLHRAFSIFIFDKNHRMLLQQRAFDKYHSGGLWSNACCSHPRPEEDSLKAAHRRLQEEMGFDCELVHAFDFVYNAKLTNDLTEHEYDQVFVGKFNGLITPNKTEVADWCWKDLSLIKQELHQAHNLYTEWFKLCFNKVI